MTITTIIAILCAGVVAALCLIARAIILVGLPTIFPNLHSKPDLHKLAITSYYRLQLQIIFLEIATIAILGYRLYQVYFTR